MGKSTLCEELAAGLPGHTSVDEPYVLLVEDGHEFPDSPTLEDHEAQLERSLELLGDGAVNVLFDRCPVDLLAYMAAQDDFTDAHLDRWVDEVRRATRTLDLIVFVPVEEPDRIAVPASEDRALRAAVDEKLRELLLDDPLDLGVEVLEVAGSVAARVRQVLRHVGGR